MPPSHVPFPAPTVVRAGARLGLLRRRLDDGDRIHGVPTPERSRRAAGRLLGHARANELLGRGGGGDARLVARVGALLRRRARSRPAADPSLWEVRVRPREEVAPRRAVDPPLFGGGNLLCPPAARGAPSGVAAGRSGTHAVRCLHHHDATRLVSLVHGAGLVRRAGAGRRTAPPAGPRSAGSRAQGEAFVVRGRRSGAIWALRGGRPDRPPAAARGRGRDRAALKLPNERSMARPASAGEPSRRAARRSSFVALFQTGCGARRKAASWHTRSSGSTSRFSISIAPSGFTPPSCKSRSSAILPTCRSGSWRTPRARWRDACIGRTTNGRASADRCCISTWMDVSRRRWPRPWSRAAGC